MNDDLRAEWLEKWQKVVIPDNQVAAKEETGNFKGFLKACPEEIEDELAREPLLLYLLAKLHKEKEIKQEYFQKSSNRTQAKILIYQKSLDWVLKEQRNQVLQYEIVGLEIDSIERILTEAGLCVVQSGKEYAKVKMIETRLAKDDSVAAAIIRKLRAAEGEQVLKNALGAFYIRPAAGEMGGGVEFYHQSFGEFLCAKRIHESLERWIQKVTIGKQKEWFISKEELARQIYDLLGYGGLNPEIVEYLLGLLQKSDEFSLSAVKLFQRLEEFYWRWCNGKFIDTDGITLPQIKMRELQEQVPERRIYLGQRQVDVYAGLNIMILLLELHRYGQSQTENIKQKLTFYPCGQLNDNHQLDDPNVLLRLIGYGNCIGVQGFRDNVGRFLSKAKLSEAELYRIDLMGADLSRTELMGADLSRSDLRIANLRGANLGNAKLMGADLGNADFREANLRKANLNDANLRKANLSNADLREAKLRDSNLRDSNLGNTNKLNRANLMGTDLSDADLVNANLRNANLKSANLRNANLVNANLSDADFTNANLSDADLREANLKNADLREANLRNANLKNANLKNANLGNADFGNADLEDIRWNKKTNRSGMRGLDTATNVPDDFKPPPDRE